MHKIKVLLDMNEYIKMMRNYFLSKSSYKIIIMLLFLIVVNGTVASVIGKIDIKNDYLIMWWVLLAVYAVMIPVIITIRAKSIYQHTQFLQNEMGFSFGDEGIEWSTSAGEKKVNWNKMYLIENTVDGMVLLFSRYQIMMIPYKCFTQENFKEIIELIGVNMGRRSKLRKRFYKKVL
ncbi:MAG: YcxB family protein [Brevinemataceae bacterium]